jgi:hypothetical protein
MQSTGISTGMGSPYFGREVGMNGRSLAKLLSFSFDFPRQKGKGVASSGPNSGLTTP